MMRTSNERNFFRTFSLSVKSECNSDEKCQQGLLKTKISFFKEKILYFLFSRLSSRISGIRPSRISSILHNYWPDIRPNQYPVQPQYLNHVELLFQIFQKQSFFMNLFVCMYVTFYKLYVSCLYLKNINLFNEKIRFFCLKHFKRCLCFYISFGFLQFHFISAKIYISQIYLNK